MAVSINKIAEICGVSRGTVSLVLNGHAGKYRISDKTVQQVLKVSKETGYCRNQLAEAVRNGHSRTLAFVSYRLGELSYIGQISDGIFAALAPKFFSLKVFQLTNETHQPIIQSLIEQRVEGVILHGAQQDELLPFQQELRHCKIPQVTVGIVNTMAGYGVTSDDASGISQMVKYLYVMGYGHFILCNREHSEEFDYSRNRRRGFDEMIHSLGKRKRKIKYEYAEPKDIPVLDFNVPGTAAVCVGDDIAVSVYVRGLREGWDMRKVAITGYGDDSFLKHAGISLTTVRQPFREMGLLATEKLIHWIEHENKSMFEKTENFSLPVELIKRNSTP